MVDELKKVLILGGARSGKSSFAEDIAYTLGKKDVTYIATAEPYDEEMAKRIKHHRQQRPDSWATVEESKDVAEKIIELADETEVILLDCLTVLVSNLLLQGEELDREDYHFSERERKSQETLAELEELATAIEEAGTNIIVVSNEIGQGLVPPYPLSRVYRDTVGRANQLLAKAVKKVYITYAGLPVEIKELGERTKMKFGGYSNDG
ncbi:bifunctional adenosylcobinamide kinase/adenosylcobinamide-phosphate guanylyltransferase [Sporohalobacter salinus]|uniref:bifunctional adenosylcobinamide kinase/adenosylcobinamide-phosphate guanylyltransferase n=1 Tax=Sporohalobacter salinus TaxID=1494606 RepID=UPI001961D123|nr:bifunctional adenosylcobinamide kinase/adenosylcobinamide-phosphate guanylyltransferase [Sporohalobacter salinus]MBM7623602.1 adenosylcobinamide kinase/adenosylcobinamide-phosphate guanylyltransferase [Sporohalobacter salinus]